MNQYGNEAIRGCLQGQLLSDFCEEWMCFTGEQITAILRRNLAIRKSISGSQCQDVRRNRLVSFLKRNHREKLRERGYGGQISKLAWVGNEWILLIGWKQGSN